MIWPLIKIPAYRMFRRFGYPRMLPLNLTIGVTNRCNSRCRTCNVYQNDVSEFSLQEFENTFQSIGTAPYWLTISGGEPFLRDDIVEICRSAYGSMKPRIINIPTNGILTRIIPEQVERIVQNSPEAKVIINLSLDGHGEHHDEIRGVPGNFDKAVETYHALKKLEYENLTLGIHSVISRFNVENFTETYAELIKLEPDSYITEIAEQRAELNTIGLDITPSLGEYSSAVDFLSSKIRERKYRGISKVTQAFRLHYYELVKRILEQKRQVLPCYAGFMSAQIAPDGQVWACCIKAESMGSLREADYDFKKIWFSAQADRLRSPIRGRECYCPLANAGYTNMLASYRTMAKVLLNLIRP